MKEQTVNKLLVFLTPIGLIQLAIFVVTTMPMGESFCINCYVNSFHHLRMFILNVVGYLIILGGIYFMGGGDRLLKESNSFNQTLGEKT